MAFEHLIEDGCKICHHLSLDGKPKRGFEGVDSYDPRSGMLEAVGVVVSRKLEASVPGWSKLL
jgi:hypothetical protein